MEPPVKRRRFHQPLSLRSSNNGEDRDGDYDSDDIDDELRHEPEAISARRDPDYQLSLERAYADNRFQATMAHIIEKYQRDFDGIGDEIDMYTGDIVVDNGHLSNMRDEADVGVGEGGEDEEEEQEGFLLEDLLDFGEYEGDQQGAEDTHKSTAKNPAAGNAKKVGDDEGDEEDEEDELRIMHGGGPEPRSNALVPSRSVRPPHFGASPFAFTESPLAFSPWDFHNDPSLLLRQQPDIAPQRARANRLALKSRGGRYSFPARTGTTSIWGGGTGYEDEVVTRFNAAKLLPRRRPKRLAPPPTNNTSGAGEYVEGEDEDDDDDDEEAILTGSRRSGRKAHIEAVVSDSEEDDAVLSGEEPLPGLYLQNSAFLAVPQGTSTGNDDLPGDRRRSKRARKSVEYMGKITWTQADRDNAKSLATASHNISAATGSSSMRPEKTSPGSKNGPKGDLVIRRKVIPDSQDSSIPSSTGTQRQEEEISSYPQKAGRQAASSHTEIDSGCVLSDDETPVQISRQPPSSKSTRHHGDPGRSQDVSKAKGNGRQNHASPASRRKPGSASWRSGRHMRSSPPSQSRSHDSSVRITRVAKSTKSPGGRVPSRQDEAAPDQQPDSGLEDIEDGGIIVHPLDHPLEADAAGRANNDDVAMLHPPSNELERNKSPELGDHWHSPATAQNDSWLRKEICSKRSKAGSLSRSNDVCPSVNHATAETTKEAPGPSSQRATGLRPTPGSEAKSRPSRPAQAEAPTPTKPKTPQTPRHRIPRSDLSPRSRRSITSLAWVNQEDKDVEADELSILASTPTGGGTTTSNRGDGDAQRRGRRSGVNGNGRDEGGSSSSVRTKLWKSTPRTTELHRTPVKRLQGDVSSPGSVIRTPGGTKRMCGVNGFRCERDFCFTCL